MAHQESGHAMRQPIVRNRPRYIVLPRVDSFSDLEHREQPAVHTRGTSSLTTSTPPRPPVPPRRHTLAEICRYADEQCAYIEWMTRQFEEEEAARRHSSPTTPAGAITNPFKGPADMWWRPSSASEMYEMSAIRRRQEERHTSLDRFTSHTATSDLQKSVDQNRKIEQVNIDTVDDQEVKSGTILLNGLTCEPLELDKTFRDDNDSKDDDVETSNFNREGLIRKHEDWSHHSAVTTMGHFDNVSLDMPTLGRSSIVLMIPKAMICFFLLPLILLVVIWSGDGALGQGEEGREDG